jgi:hypothetical protein
VTELFLPENYFKETFASRGILKYIFSVKDFFYSILDYSVEKNNKEPFKYEETKEFKKNRPELSDITI